MIRQGMRVARQTKKVGQAAPEGKVVEIHGDHVTVKWDDGHESVVSRIGIVPVKESKA
jgi:hypothetical protein